MIVITVILVVIIVGESEKGTNGVSTDGVLQILCFLTEGLLGYSR